MSQATFNTVGCPGCRKRFVWKPELAGQAVRCTCGHAFVIGDAPENLPLMERPSPAAVAASIKPSDFEFTPTDEAPRPVMKCPSCNLPMRPGAAVCLNCGYDLRVKEKVKTRVVDVEAEERARQEAARAANRPDGGEGGPAGAAADISPSHPPPGTTPARAVSPVPVADFVPAIDQSHAATQARRGSRAGRALANREDEVAGSKFLDFYLPVFFIVAGIVFSIFIPMINGKPFLAGIIYMGVQLVVKVPLMLVAFSIAAKLFDISFGPLSTGLLKLAGIAMGPMALANLILGVILGVTMGMGIWLAVAVYLVIAGIPLAYMFDMDLNETLLTVVVIVGTELGFNLFVLAILLGMFS